MNSQDVNDLLIRLDERTKTLVEEIPGIKERLASLEDEKNKIRWTMHGIYLAVSAAAGYFGIHLGKGGH